MKKNDGVFRKRLEKYEDELRMALYGTVREWRNVCRTDRSDV